VPGHLAVYVDWRVHFKWPSRERSAGRRSSLAHDHECEFKVVSYERVPRLVVYGPSGAVIPFHLVHHPTADFPLTSKLPKPFALAAHKSAYVRFEQFGCMVGTETTTTKVALLLPKATHPTQVLTLLRPIARCVGPSARQANPIGISPIEPTIAGTGDYQS